MKRRRGKGRPFKKGESGNPKGRPPIDYNIKAACQKLAPNLIEILKNIAESEDAKHADRIRAADILLDRGFGRAIQPTKDLGAGESWKDFWESV